MFSETDYYRRKGSLADVQRMSETEKLSLELRERQRYVDRINSEARSRRSEAGSRATDADLFRTDDLYVELDEDMLPIDEERTDPMYRTDDLVTGAPDWTGEVPRPRLDDLEGRGVVLIDERPARR
jgi:hypothetical protein